MLRLFPWLTRWPVLSAKGMSDVHANIDCRLELGILTRAWLTLRIHLHALHETPRAYSLAAWWRIRGKRVRAHAQFAPLLARSPLTYRLWIATEPSPPIRFGSSQGAARIVALIHDDKADAHALARTQASLAAQGIPALIAVPSSSAADLFDGHAECWIMPIFAGDMLAPGAGEAYRRAITPGTRLIYSDDDLLGTQGQRHSPHFKPTWNSELFRHLDYLTGACILRAHASTIAELGDGWPARIVAAVATADEGMVSHIAQVLHHRRGRPAPHRLPAVPIEDAALPRASVIIPTRNGLDLLRTCMEGLARTRYPDMEIIIVDNGSDDPATLAYLDALRAAGHHILHHPGPFNFSSLNNRAAAQASGDLLCLLNNDIEIVDPDWLRIMAVQALRPDIGAVGAQLLYPDGRIQHAGVVLGICGGAAHAHRLLRPDEEGYHRRHALPQFTSAVTAACLVVQRAHFEAVGGLDETHFPVAFNDVDFCMRLNRMGWQSLYEPRARLIHHESVSRGFDRDSVGAARLAGELAALKDAWGTHEVVDPFHHPQLNRFSEHFVVRL